MYLLFLLVFTENCHTWLY